MPQASKSLRRRNSPLSQAHAQLRVLNEPVIVGFEEKLRAHGLLELKADGVEILQVNVGKLCNMTCQHCHVDAGPDRREIMSLDTIALCLEALRSGGIATLDLTGGAPEMNPHFRYFVQEARRLGVHVIDRCNLTILLAPGYEDLAQFLADQDVEIVASLPCYLEENTDRQRGDGAFRQSIEALRILNGLGYGVEGSGRTLTLVYNPVGTSLPPDQQQLESQYRERLQRDHGVAFSRLFTIANMPISRFLESLLAEGQLDAYMEKLVEAFNPAVAQGVMCRKMVSVGWDGLLYDCDFNQMLETPTAPDTPRRIQDFDLAALEQRRIVTGPHCFGCTAGAGSGCLGAISSETGQA